VESLVERRTIQKLTRRVVYFLGILFFMSFIDRANIGMAALRMNVDLKFSATIYGLGAGLFFIAYAIFEIPSNLILHRVGARTWIARIMVTWGIVSACFAFIQGAHSFYLLRFLLGAAEAGFVPGIVYYLALWFPPAHRAKAYAIAFAFPLAALIVMGPISSWLMTVTGGLFGISGWRWMFLFEGFPAAILGVITFFYLKDRPEDANWLTPEEKKWICDALEEGRRNTSPIEHHSVAAFCSDKRLWVLTALYFLWNFGGYGIMFWLPLILKSVGKFSSMQIGLLYSIPFLCAFICLLLVGSHSDRTGERKMHIIVCALCAFVSLAASALVPSPILAFILISIAAGSIWGMQPVFWTLPADYLSGVTAAAGIALVNAAAGIGGFVGPFIVGWVRDKTGRFEAGVMMLSLAFLVLASIVMAMKIKRTIPTAQPRTEVAASNR
jgi:D-galactonate transporter